MPSSFSHEPETTAQTLVALGKVPLNDELFSKSPEEDLGTTAGLEEEAAKIDDEGVSLANGVETTVELLRLANVVAAKTRAVEDATKALQQQQDEDAQKMASNDALQKANDEALLKANAEALQKAHEDALQMANAVAQQKANQEALQKAIEDALQNANAVTEQKAKADAVQTAMEELRKKKDQEDASLQQQGAAESLQQQKDQAAAAPAKEELQKTMEKEEAAQQQEAAADTLEQKKAADDKGETDTDSQVIKLSEPGVFSRDGELSEPCVFSRDGETITIGDKVAKFFGRKELKPGLGKQWIQGKVAACKWTLKKGSKTIQQPWWTLTMDAPLDKKLLCCNSEDVAEMK